MSNNYKTLDHTLLGAEIKCLKPFEELPQQASMDDPAINAMTDLTKTTALVIGPCATLKEATERMIASNVQLLFVTNQYHHIIGIITSKDVEGEKVMRHIAQNGGNRDDIMVRDLMTPQINIEVLNIEDVRNSLIGDIAETLTRMGRQHALVIEEDAEGNESIRGVLSTTQIRKQTGITINTSDVASGVAGMQAALGN
ncbi:MAG: CBS domain-containing protein [Gammaproteobacteria bacterium]|nr:CBS domain-containing protein [Gammaproteobacteria bacterium]